MSLLALIAAGGGAAPPPADYVTAISPAWQNIVRVGPTRTHTTLDAGLAAAKAENGGIASNSPSTGLYGGGMFSGTPRVARFRTAVVVDPGSYTISSHYLDSHGGFDLVGATGNPADVELVVPNHIATTGATSYVMNLVNDFYTAHVTYRIPKAPVTTGKSYAIHMTWMSSRVPTTNIYENCVIVDEDEGRNGGSIGWDGEDESLLYMKDCTLMGPRSPILHGRDAQSGITIALDGCTLNVPGIPGFTGATTVTKDCTHNGQPVPDSGELPTLTDASHRPERFAPSTATTGPITLTPLPSPPSDIGPVALAPGVVYYVPVPVDVAGRIGQVAASMPTPQGSVALGLYTETIDGGFRPASLGGIYQDTPSLAASTVSRGLSPTTHWPRGYATRDDRLWAAILVTDASARVQGSTNLSSTVTCYRSADARTGVGSFPNAPLEQVPAGTAVPWLSLSLD